eukprot:g3538.t1
MSFPPTPPPSVPASRDNKVYVSFDDDVESKELEDLSPRSRSRIDKKLNILLNEHRLSLSKVNIDDSRDDFSSGSVEPEVPSNFKWHTLYEGSLLTPISGLAGTKKSTTGFRLKKTTCKRFFRLLIPENPYLTRDICGVEKAQQMYPRILWYDSVYAGEDPSVLPVGMLILSPGYYATHISMTAGNVSPTSLQIIFTGAKTEWGLGTSTSRPFLHLSSNTEAGRDRWLHCITEAVKVRDQSTLQRGFTVAKQQAIDAYTDGAKAGTLVGLRVVNERYGTESTPGKKEEKADSSTSIKKERRRRRRVESTDRERRKSNGKKSLRREADERERRKERERRREKRSRSRDRGKDPMNAIKIKEQTKDTMNAMKIKEQPKASVEKSNNGEVWKTIVPRGKFSTDLGTYGHPVGVSPNFGGKLFQVRSLQYAKRHKKQPSSWPMYDDVGILFHRSKNRINHIANRLIDLPHVSSELVSRCYKHDIPPILFLNFQMPHWTPTMLLGTQRDGDTTHAVIALRASQRILDFLDSHAPGNNHDVPKVSDIVSGNVPSHGSIFNFQKWCRDADRIQGVKGKFKCIPIVENMDVIGSGSSLLRSFNGKPFMVDKSGRFLRGVYKLQDVVVPYIEYDVDISLFKWMAIKGYQRFLPSVKSLHMRLGIVIEGRKEEELPEQVIAAFGLTCVDVLNPKYFSKLKTK